jgi:Holliday junction DNA helicase RuvA
MVERRINSVLLDLSGICYEVLIPSVIMQKITETTELNKEIKLITYHYLQDEHNKSRPVLIGFLNDIERDFFEQFITVSGIGPRAAIKALNQPISRIAQAIDDADTAFLCGLPGIGQQRAKEIIAKLQGKVGKFGLIQDKVTGKILFKDDLKKEAVEVLLQLQYKKTEAEEMVKKALEKKPELNTAEELLNEIYKQKKQ